MKNGIPIEVDTRSSLRYFIFWVGNSTLLSGLAEKEGDEPDYLHAILETPSLFGTLVEAFFAQDYGGVDPADWLYLQLTADAPNAAPQLSTTAPEWMRDIIEFAHNLAMDHLQTSPSKSSDILKQPGGSPLESVFAVLSNVLRVDKTGRSINKEHSYRRAMQMIRYLLEKDYQPVPPFSATELELV